MSLAANTAVGPPPGMRVRLSSNESPIGPSPAAVAAASDALATAHLYPDDQAIDLRARLATHESVTPDQVAVATGSAALLMSLVDHECRGPDAPDGPHSVLAYERSFVVYRLAARNAGATYVEATTGGPATVGQDGYGREVEPLLDRVDDTTRVVIIDNPGNPTGAHLTGEQLTEIVAGIPDDVTILIDEAYHEFASGQRGYATVAELGLTHPRLLVSRTFSKAYGMGGLRVGYVFGPADLVASIDAWRPRFNVTSPAQAAAIAALGDTGHLKETIETAVAGRTRLAEALRDRGIAFTDSLTNFLTVETPGAADDVVEAFAGHGIGVRPLAPYGMANQVRISIGRPEEMTEVIEVLDDVFATT